MADYIEREALRLAIFNTRWWNTVNVDIAYDMAENIPAADVEPVRHGRWNADGRCTVCGGHAPFYAMSREYYKSDYCFECGARMDGDSDD